ncbi:hypothetical protein ACJX0J_013262, partial [Zea mays]
CLSKENKAATVQKVLGVDQSITHRASHHLAFCCAICRNSASFGYTMQYITNKHSRIISTYFYTMQWPVYEVKTDISWLGVDGPCNKTEGL